MKLILIPLFILFLTTCSGTGMKFLHHTDKEIINLSKVKINYPNTKFIVISDLHLYDTNLGISGSAFQNYLDDDRKLLVESEEILQQAINEISKLDFDFIIIPGDLTKDGEKESHIKLSNILRKFLNNNKKVFVVPGNHDINNPESLMYQEDKKIPVPGITPKEFSEIYSDFGYKHAIYRDDDSLSYVVEPIDGLWLLALDPCLYKQNTNKTHPVTEGEFSESTLKWIEDILIKSKREKKAVIAFMHHGITPHYPANLKYYPEYVLNNYEIICELFSSYNVKLTFTGHYHAQDITKVEKNNNTIYDIETGSLVTFPCPYRLITITNNILSIESYFIKEIPSRKDFHTYASNYVFEGTIKIAKKKLKSFNVSDNETELIAPQAIKAYITHLQGDEIKPANIIDTSNIGLWGWIVINYQKDLIEGWYTDYEPSDNFLTINLD